MAMAAEILQDEVVLRHAIATLRRKDGFAGGEILRKGDEMARRWSDNTGLEKEMMDTIVGARKRGNEKRRGQLEEAMLGRASIRSTRPLLELLSPGNIPIVS
jgi:hypothetical protein